MEIQTLKATHNSWISTLTLFHLMPVKSDTKQMPIHWETNLSHFCDAKWLPYQHYNPFKIILILALSAYNSKMSLMTPIFIQVLQ